MLTGQDPISIRRVDAPLISSYTSVIEFNVMAYPLGIDNPIRVKGIIGTTKWALYWRDDHQKIATFSNQFAAYEARRAIIEQYQKEKE